MFDTLSQLNDIISLKIVENCTTMMGVICFLVGVVFSGWVWYFLGGCDIFLSGCDIFLSGCDIFLSGCDIFLGGCGWV